MNAWHRRMYWIAAALFVASFGIATGRGLLKPYTNWDMVAYVGSAISWQERDPATIHSMMLADVREAVSDWRYREIAEENPLSNDPERFVQHLPFYVNKPLYIGVVRLIRASGLTNTYSAATWTASALSMAALAALLWFWPTEHVNRIVWLLLVAAFCWFGNHPFSTLARFSTPDAMGTLALLASFLIWRRRRRPYWGIAASLIAILIRPEAVILVVMCAVFFVLARSVAPLSRRQSVVMALCACALYGAVQVISGAYGYEKYFSYTYIYRTPEPALATAPATFSAYWNALLTGVKGLHADSRLIPSLIASGLAAYCWRRRRLTGVYPWLLLLAWSNYAVRFLLSPAWNEYRYYAINYLLILIAVSEMVAGCLTPDNDDSCGREVARADSSVQTG